MPRPRRCRRVCSEPVISDFAPVGNEARDSVELTVDEYEALRLVDYDKMTHTQCAQQMDISRSTVTEIYASARYKLADCLVNGKCLSIIGGNYRLCNGSASENCGGSC